MNFSWLRSLFFWSGWMVLIAKSNILCKMNVNISRQQATSVLSDSSPENAPYSSLPPLMDVSWLGRSWWSSTPGLQLGKRVNCDQTKSNIETFFSQRAELEVAPASRELPQHLKTWKVPTLLCTLERSERSLRWWLNLKTDRAVVRIERNSRSTGS